jgi:hypothetical protein
MSAASTLHARIASFVPNAETSMISACTIAQNFGFHCRSNGPSADITCSKAILA